ncbi:MAG: AlwI family type II restriction endonuclease [Bacteroidales bacterium]|nr:AlwI family type II restriction endonuclease [Bacteroidales bacterium]
MKLLSFSTTVRNPERIRNFLKVLKLLEGKIFNKKNQEKFQILLIQHKYYKPNNIQPKFKQYFDDPELKLPYDVAKEIFYYQNYVDPSHRGRESANPLNKLGFCIARDNYDVIKITELGNKLLSDDYDIGLIFFKSLLKLQYPNPWSKDFTSKQGFNIQPFIATMHLINQVNIKSNKKGLNRNEFSLFAPSLINFKKIDYYVEKVFEYRNTNDKKTFIYNWAMEFYNTNKPSDKQVNNFWEYGDNIMRYFRLTRYFKVFTNRFGGDWRIDLEPTRRVETIQLLKSFVGKAQDFDVRGYLTYLADYDLPKLPFENIENLKQVVIELVDNINEFVMNNKIELDEIEKALLKTDLTKFGKNELENLIYELRILNITVKERNRKFKLLSDIDNLRETIEILKDTKRIRKIDSLRFEKFIVDTLRILNDELIIQPNYIKDDDGEPISHAPGNKPDIECYYKSYNAICEVTLLQNNYQWIRETQPVMRHFRDFEKRSERENNYCLFIAPKIHQDTAYHFWISIKYGYKDGATQKILPITTEQLSVVMETLLEMINKGNRIKHNQLSELYEEIINKTNNVEGYEVWLNEIQDVIKSWKNKILN